MAAGLDFDSVPGFEGTLEIRPVSVDELSPVRYVHATSLRGQGSGCYTAEELDAFEAMVRSVRYTEIILKDTLIGGWIGQELVGTAAWGVVDDSGRTARIDSVFVRPFFTGMGIGQRLVGTAETLASRAGYRSFSVRATLNAVAFFEQLGYAVTSHGTRPLSPEIALAVAFMRKDLGAGPPSNDVT
jgi:GNAT superfamily N-acetyltransferase